jgi:hypothetical protein
MSILHVTPDGKAVLDAKPMPFLQTPFDESQGRFSPEASPRWVAYQSNETGRHEVYVQSFPNARNKFQISTGGGRFPQWGAGGREIFYLSPDQKLMSVDVKLGADSIEPSTPRELFPLPVTCDSSRPYEAATDGRRFLVCLAPGQSAQPLTILMNWPALLDKGMAAQ